MWQEKMQLQRERDLMALIFHELRNPLNGCVGHLRLLSSGGECSCEAAERVSAALTCTDHALEFLSTLSQLEKLEAVGEPSVASSQQPVELASLLDRCFTIAAPQLAQGVAMRISSKDVRELWVRVDSVVLSEVLINLLQARHYPSDRARMRARLNKLHVHEHVHADVHAHVCAR